MILTSHNLKVFSILYFSLKRSTIFAGILDTLMHWMHTDFGMEYLRKKMHTSQTKNQNYNLTVM